MSTWQVTNRLTGEVVYAYASDDPVEWPGMEYAENNPVRVVDTVEVPKRRLTKLEFIGRMGEPVFIAILAMAQQSVEMAAWVELVRMATPDPDGTNVDLDDPRTLAGLNALEPVLIAQGIVAEGWAAGVVA